MAIAAALLAIGVSVLFMDRHQRSNRPEIVIDDPLAATTLVVSVVGAVATPGMYELPADARVQHALDAAGGLRADADLAAVNPAVRVQDGQQIIVAEIRQENDSPDGVVAAATSEPVTAVHLTPDAGDGNDVAAHTPTAQAMGLLAETDSNGLATIDINTATEEELDRLPGIGEVKAAAIVAYRTEHGPFRDIAELADVDGISEAMVAELSPYIRVEP